VRRKFKRRVVNKLFLPYYLSVHTELCILPVKLHLAFPLRFVTWMILDRKLCL